MGILISLIFIYSGTLQPLSVVHKDDIFFLERLYIVIPLSGAVVVLLVLVAGLALYCSRRRQLKRYKGGFKYINILGQFMRLSLLAHMD